MPYFFGISMGEEKAASGIRVKVSDDGARVWMHGKWLDLGEDHAVAWVNGAATFIRADGRCLSLGQFPGWVVRGIGRGAPLAIMFSIAQFRGGSISVKNGKRVNTDFVAA